MGADEASSGCQKLSTRLRLSHERSGVRRDPPPGLGHAGPPQRWRRRLAASPRLGHCLSRLEEDEKRRTREDGAGDGGGNGRRERGGVGWVRRSRRPASGEWERLKKCRWLLADGGWMDCGRLAPIDRRKLMTNNQDFECNPSLCRQRHATRAEYLRRRHDRFEGDYR